MAQSMFRVTVDTSGMIPWEGRTKSQVNRASKMSGSSALRAMGAEASRQIRARKAMKVAAVNKALTLIFPQGNQNVWMLRASADPMPVIAFNVRQTAKPGRDLTTGRLKKARRVKGGAGGVYVQINKDSRKLIRGAFIATMKSGHTGVFYRTGDKRLPIEEAYTSRVSEVVSDAMPAIQERGRSVFTTSFQRIIKSA